jgi:hypothetical protein
VVQEAADSGMPLLYAYLRYCHGEQTRISRAAAAMAAAQQASAGGQQGEAQPAPDPAVEAMMRGVWN